MKEQNLKDIYKNNPADFVEECFEVKLLPYQKEILNKLASKQKEYICWNRVNQKYYYAMFEIMRLLLNGGNTNGN